LDYEDFELRIEPEKRGKYRVLVLSSPAGESSGLLQIPPFLQEASPRAHGGSRKRHLYLETADTDGPDDLEATGSALFQALFSDSVLELYRSSLDIVNVVGTERGLRIRLHIDPERPGLKQISCLHWELLHDRECGFLGLSPRSLLSRYLDVPLPSTPIALDDPLRVLVVLALPKDVDFLDLRMELRALESAWRGVEGVDLHVLEGATRDCLRKALAREPWHVLHFMGHGESAGGEGALVLEGDGGKVDLLPGSELAELLGSRQRPALVVLNACQTADGSRAADAFAGIGGALVKAGVLSVVAMQAPISDDAALAFSKGLYRGLAAGDPVDAAVTMGRRAIQTTQGSTDEWFIPILFLRRRDGKIFDPVRVPLREQDTARRLARAMSRHQQEQLVAELDPGGVMEPGAEEEIYETAALSGGEDWLHYCEVLLALRSPVYPFDGSSLSGWSPQPRRNWKIHGERLVGVGEDLEGISLLSWEGLRFRDGSVEARVEIPLLALGGAAGLVLHWTGRSAVLGLLRGDPDTGGARAEILQQRGKELSALRSVPIKLQKEPYDVRLSVDGRRATLHVGGEAIVCDLEADPVPGYAGLVKLGGALAYFRRPAVAVANHVSSTKRRSP